MVNALFWVRKWGDWWYYNSTKNSKTCNWGLKLPSKTCAIWIYNILWNSWPVVHYTVRKTWHNVTNLPDWDVSTMETTHRVHWSINNPSKSTPPLFRQDPLKSSNCLSCLLLGNSTISCFFCDPHPLLKNAFFKEPHYLFL